MLARVESFLLRGIDAVPCEIEVDISTASLPSTTIVGLPDVAVRESLQRVRTALLNAGFRYPKGRVTINLAPADVRKEGPVYDLPIAVALLRADGTIESDAESGLLAGELALDGRLRPIRGGISLAMLARRLGRCGIIVPAANAGEAALVEGIDVIGAECLDDVVAHLNRHARLSPEPPAAAGPITDRRPEIDFADIRGQEAAKRALSVAAAGGHNVIMIGPAGTGKTMMAKALPGVLPPLTRDEALEVTHVHSIAGGGSGGRRGPLVVERPVRAPHHTASAAAIIGGGSVPRPGDVSLAHRGVLFLDEMPEFSRAVLETLRQPLEDGCVTIARAAGSFRFPARFMLVGALNPTSGGVMGADPRSHRDMSRYLSKLSAPLVDRIDLHVEVPSVSYRELTGPRNGASSAEIRARVVAARAIQHGRQGARSNADLSGRALDRYAALDQAARTLLGQAMTELGLSARAYDRVRRVARTIADLDAAPDVAIHHIAEAVQYRLLDRLSTVVGP